MGSLQERTVTLINRPPSERAARDIEMVLLWLQKRSQLLMELDRDTLKDILRHCSYEKAANDDIILKQGDRGDKFYVIMTGRASVYIVTKTEEDQAANEEASGTPSKAKAAKQGQEEAAVDEASNGEANEENGQEELDRTMFGKFIMYYGPGTSFGEIALLSAEATRNATIIADMDTDLLVIDRSLFNRSVKAKEEEAYRERVDFVVHHDLFSSWTVKLRRLLEMSLKKEIHPYGSVIMRQGQPAHGLVFILSGQARVCMEPSRHESQYPALLKPPPDPLTTANKKPPVRDRAKTPKARKTHAQIEIRRQEGYAAAEKRLRGRTVDVCCLERNEIIGDTEMVLELDTNLATVVSAANTEIFVLNAKNYDRLVAKKHPHTVRLLLQHVCQKLTARLQSAKVAQLPILRCLHTAATSYQRRLGGTDGLRRVQPKGDPQEQQSENKEEKTLVRMFLQGKIPLIKPCIPDSLFYREASAARGKMLMNSPYAKLRTINMLSTYTTLRRKTPRSIQQLKGNVKAERELLGYPEIISQRSAHAEEDDDDDDDYGTPARLNLPLRPASAAPGFQSSRITASPFPSARPRSAMDMRIVPCQEENPTGAWGAAASYGWGSNSSRGAGEKVEENDTLDTHTVCEIFHHMDAVQRDKNESRMRVLCTNTARSELRTKLEREPAWSGDNTHGYEELYEDSFFDYETSDGNLRDLEQRIASFCSHHVQRPASSRSRPTITQMKRFEVEDPNNIPLPGGTVFVHQKPCRYTPTPSQQNHHISNFASNAASAPHSHVRRFMLQRDKPSQVFFGS